MNILQIEKSISKEKEKGLVQFRYLCADQTNVQRVLAARREDHARIGPIFANWLFSSRLRVQSRSLYDSTQNPTLCTIILHSLRLSSASWAGSNPGSRRRLSS